MRLNVRCSDWASELISSVLARPGTPSKQRVPAGEHRDQHLLDHVVLADDDFRQLVAQAVIGLLAPLHRGDIVGVGLVGHVDLQYSPDIVDEALPLRAIAASGEACPTLNPRSRNTAAGALRSRGALCRGPWPGSRLARLGGSLANHGSSLNFEPAGRWRPGWPVRPGCRRSPPLRPAGRPSAAPDSAVLPPFDRAALARGLRDAPGIGCCPGPGSADPGLALCSLRRGGHRGCRGGVRLRAGDLLGRHLGRVRHKARAEPLARHGLTLTLSLPRHRLTLPLARHRLALTLSLAGIG